MIARIYARQNGTLAHVWDDDYGTPEENTTLAARFFIADYPAIYQQIADNVKAVLFTNGNLMQGETVIVDSVWITARIAEITQAETIETTDLSEREQLLNLAEIAITNIASDRQAIATGLTALAAATTLAQVKPIVQGMLSIQDNTLNRQDRVIKALRAVLRSGLGSP